jgi:cytochrome c-type biogenesis protein CcmF
VEIKDANKMTDIGFYTLYFSMVFSAFAIAGSLIGARNKKPATIAAAKNSLIMVCAMLSITTAALLYALVTKDFQIKYVAEYASADLPLAYRISSFYAGQAGSLLMWAWVLSILSVIVVLKFEKEERETAPYIMAVLMTTVLFFVAIMIAFTHPLEKLMIAPLDGRGLNPLLQNPGMFFHPPTLYLGYIGFTIAYAYAIASLLTRKMDSHWIVKTRAYTIFAWYFLTLGNLFGSWWAYRELGWGGFWMWDPVENASFMPWLTGTAFLHSVMIQEKRDMLKVWNMILIIATFSLTLFGTFLTRSGVISSVHSFTASPLGPFFLGFIAVVLFFSITLLFTRLDMLKGSNQLDSMLSRESSFLFNNLLLVGATFAVLWGTIFPLISEAVTGEKITVGPPFYNQVMLPIFLALLFLTGLCPLLAWRKTSSGSLRRNFLLPSVITGVSVPAIALTGIRSPLSLTAFFLAVFVTATILMEFARGARARNRLTGEMPLKALANLVGKNRRRYGGYVIHLGVVLMFIGAAGQSFRVEEQTVLDKGQAFEIGEYSLVYNGLSSYRKPHKQVVYADILLKKNGRELGTIKPAKEFHHKSETPTTEVAVRSGPKEDLFVILAGYEEGRAAIKVIINPLIYWFWRGGFLMTVGTTIVLWPNRRSGKKQGVMIERSTKLKREEMLRK